MRKLWSVSVAMLIWGSQAVASLPPPASPAELQRISDWAAHLNHYYPTLDLEVKASLNRDQNVRAVLREMKMLEENLLGTLNLNARALQTLACKHIVCGGGDR